MAKSTRKNADGRSWEDRIGGFADQIGSFANFDHDAIDEDVSEEDRAIDGLVEKFGHLGMTARLANAIIVDRRKRDAAIVGSAAESVMGAGPEAVGECLARSILNDDAARHSVMQLALRVWERPKPRLSAGALVLALGQKLPTVKGMIRSERELANNQGVSVEHVSNEVEGWQEELRLPRTEFQKSQQAVEASRLHNRNTKNEQK